MRRSWNTRLPGVDRRLSSFQVDSKSLHGRWRNPERDRTKEKCQDGTRVHALLYHKF